MRSREDITKEIVGFDDSDLILEILLDIRELLLKQEGEVM